MTGAKLQLYSRGTESAYLTKNPQISFFKKIYMKHSNFAMQTIDLPFHTVSNLSLDSSTKIKTTLDKNGDLIHKLFVEIDIPEIYSIPLLNSGLTYKNFHWANNISEIIIKNARIVIGGHVIEEYDSEYIHVYNRLSKNSDRQAQLDNILCTNNLKYNINNYRKYSSDKTENRSVSYTQQFDLAAYDETLSAIESATEAANEFSILYDNLGDLIAKLNIYIATSPPGDLYDVKSAAVDINTSIEESNKIIEIANESTLLAAAVVTDINISHRINLDESPLEQCAIKVVNTSRRLFNLSNAITTIIKQASDINETDAIELKGYIDDASDLKGEALIDTSDALTSLKEAENGVTKTESRSYVNTGYNIIPSTTKQSIKIPLPFWFHRNIGCSLPISNLLYHDAIIEIEIRPLNQLLNCVVDNTISGSGGEIIHSQIKSISETSFNKHEIMNIFKNNRWEFSPVLNATYIFLDKGLQQDFRNNTLQYIVEPVRKMVISNVSGKISSLEKITGEMPNHPCKELFVIPRRTDMKKTNNWLNFTNWDTNSNTKDFFDYQTYFYELAIKNGNNNPLKYLLDKILHKHTFVYTEEPLYIRGRQVTLMKELESCLDETILEHAKSTFAGDSSPVQRRSPTIPSDVYAFNKIQMESWELADNIVAHTMLQKWKEIIDYWNSNKMIPVSGPYSITQARYYWAQVWDIHRLHVLDSELSVATTDDYKKAIIKKTHYREEWRKEWSDYVTKLVEYLNTESKLERLKLEYIAKYTAADNQKTLDKGVNYLPYDVELFDDDSQPYRHEALLSLDDISKFANIWNYRDFNLIPSINRTTYPYFSINIIKDMTILLDDMVRVEKKDYDYYNKIQPYIHHQSYVEGICSYSFSLYPDRFQPSGSCNLAHIKNINLEISLKDPNTITYGDDKKSTETYKYDVNVYMTYYNILEIKSGMGDLLFKI
jgi:hypothetical protein